MKSIIKRSFVGTVVLAIVAPTLVHAVSPRLSNILPRGGQRGNDVEVTFYGRNLNDAEDVLFHEPGISLVEIEPQDNDKARGVLKIAPDCKIGPHAVRVRTRTGLTNLVLFSVGNLTEVEEAEPNNDTEQAQTIALNSTVNGRVTNEDVDYFAVELVEGGRLAVEAEAIRLGGPLFDIKVRLFSPDGHEIVAEDDTALVQQDAAFVHTAETAGVHHVVVSEASYGGGGNYRYRLHMGEFPRPLAANPWGGKPGAETNVTWLGDPSVTSQIVAMPEAVNGITWIVPASDQGVAPTAVPFRVTPYDGVVEAEPNNARDKASAGAVPGAFDGVISEPGDEDWFSFEGKQNQEFEVQVWARSLGSPLDSVLDVFKPDGGHLSGNDDSGGGLDSSTRVKLPADGTYTIRVRDHLGGGGPTYAYRVEALPVTSSLSLSEVTSESGDIVVPRGGRTLMVLNASRTGFRGDVEVQFENLPEGVTAEYGPMPANQGRLRVMVQAAPDAPLGATLANVLGKHASDPPITGGFEQDIVLVEGRNQTVFQDYTADRLAIAVTEEAPFSIRVEQRKAPLVKSAAADLRVIAERKEGFNNNIGIAFPSLPPGFKAGNGTIPEGKNETTIRFEIRGDAPTGETLVLAQGTSAGYKVASEFTPVPVTEQWVTFSVGDVQAEQGTEIEVPVKVNQNHAYEGGYEARMVALPKGVSTEPVTFNSETKELIFKLKIAEDAPEGKHNGMRIASTLQSEGEPIPHASGGATLKVYKPLPPELKQASEPKKEEKKEKKVEKKRTRFPETSQ